MRVKTRFAPSPTGFLHVGGLRTALFNYLFARKNGGKFLLRIEDTDQERLVEGGIENILKSLCWAGISPDEGVWLKEMRNEKLEMKNVAELGGNGPYIQSKRLSIYKKYVQILLDNGHAYHCFCAKERLEELREIQEAARQPTGYDGRCRGLTEDERTKEIKNERTFVIRMKMPREGETAFTDLARGNVSFDNRLIDDHVLIKSDGFPTYHFAVVVDDHLMEITHVIRGEEWLPSTPKHLALYRAFGWETPVFVHLPLLVNENKQKLSKRHGDVSVEDFRKNGYLAEALVNFIAFLGWNPGDEREIFSLSELEKEFDFGRVSKSPAVFNREKLHWYNGQYIRRMKAGELVNACLPYWENAGVFNNNESGIMNYGRLKAAVGLVKDRLVKLSDIVELTGFVFAEKLEYEPSLLVWKKSTSGKTKENLRQLSEFLSLMGKDGWTKNALEAKVGEWIMENNFGTGDVLWPMRVALSGQKNSPGPYEIAAVLGKDKTLARFADAIKILV